MNPLSPDPAMDRTAREILDLVRTYGAHRLSRISLRANRRTIWSLTQDGTVLNLHVAFASAPAAILRAFAVVANEAHAGTRAYHRAARRIASWEPLHREIRRLRARDRRHSAPLGPRRGMGPCCATEAQRRYLRRLYLYLNRTRFGGRLPARVPLRLSSRMRSRLGQMVAGHRAGQRIVVEIALNLDLMLQGNGKARLDTLVHEMAHAADWLFDGQLGHGPTWKRWARRARCEDTSCATTPIRHRRHLRERVTRVPRLPLGARLRLGLDSREAAA